MEYQGNQRYTDPLHSHFGYLALQKEAKNPRSSKKETSNTIPFEQGFSFHYNIAVLIQTICYFCIKNVLKSFYFSSRSHGKINMGV